MPFDRPEKPEGEFDAARTRTEVNAAAKKLQRAKAELKRLQEGDPSYGR